MRSESVFVMLVFSLAIGFVVSFGQVAAAAPEALIASGEFETAYREAIAAEDARSLVLAARAASLQATYVVTDRAGRVEWLERAADAASMAIELEPATAQTHFELARAEGVLAQYRGVLANLNTAPRLKELFDRTLELEPDHADALVALAQWHMELTERGVGWLYGGDRGRVLPLFEQALSLRPEQINLHVEYATTLERLGKAEEAREQLEIALALEPRTAVDRYEQARARRLLAGD